MGNTIKVAADRAYDQTKTVLPAEVARGVFFENVPSLQGLKLMHLMIAKAGGRMAEDVRHEFRLSDLKKIEGMKNHTRATLTPLFQELRAMTIIEGSVDNGTENIVVGGLLDQAVLDRVDPISGDFLLSWYFGRSFMDMARKSNHWAILDRQSLFHLNSRYSVLLFQYISSLVNLNHMNSKRFTVTELRAMFAIPEGRLSRFSNLKQKVIQPAVDEINSDVTRLQLTVSYHKVGRTVSEVEIAWDAKNDLAKVRAEQDRSKVGRKSRREGTVEKPVLSFPTYGTIKGTEPWEKIARENAPRIQGNHMPDLLTLSDTFRRWCRDKNVPLDALSIEKTFTTWCKTYSVR